MRTLIQRVTHASVTIKNQVYSQIGQGLLVLLGIGNYDKMEDIEWLTKKVIQLRIFEDGHGLMNKSVLDIDGEILIVSQFTLMASYKKGNRPSFLEAANRETAIPLYEETIKCFSQHLKKPVKTGVFGADMKINLENSGPVTIMMDSRDKQ